MIDDSRGRRSSLLGEEVNRSDLETQYLQRARTTDHGGVPMTTTEQIHDEGCGHVAFQHADHVDYAHDGHVHRQREGQWADVPVGVHRRLPAAQAAT